VGGKHNGLGIPASFLNRREDGTGAAFQKDTFEGGTARNLKKKDGTLI
jgi:hypothetical protein